MPKRTPSAEGTTSTRPLRVGEEIRHALAAILGRGELRDPALAGLSITVGEVRVSPDLMRATVFVTPLGGGDAAGVVKALNHASPFLRSQVVKAVRLRRAPELSFAPDTSFDYAQRIEDALRAPAVRRDIDRPAGDDDPDDESR